MVSPKFTVLCVDDEEIPLYLRKRVLEKSGYEVLTATSARQALEILHERRVHVVLSDQLMPNMTGTELAKAIKERYPEIPVVLVSGVNEFPPDVGYANAFLSKLEGPATMCQKLAEILGKVPASLL